MCVGQTRTTQRVGKGAYPRAKRSARRGRIELDADGAVARTARQVPRGRLFLQGGARQEADA